jgi:hypothetical protein
MVGAAHEMDLTILDPDVVGTQYLKPIPARFGRLVYYSGHVITDLLSEETDLVFATYNDQGKRWPAITRPINS